MMEYQYQEFQSDDSIRLVNILPEQFKGQPIHCNITTHRLSDSSVVYEALSYTWGDLTQRLPISCGDPPARLEVTRNCYNALRSLRLKDSVRVVWIDAISINQQDISERTSQVRMMDRIFGSAMRVVAYLGEETAETHLVFDDLHEYEKSLETGDEYREPPSIEITRELDAILQRPYFTRVWVLQEIYMAKSVYIMCGSACATLDAFYDCVFGYSSNNRVTETFMPHVFQWENRSGPEYAISSSRRGSYDAAKRLWYILGRTRYCLATDPRDRVFALRSLLPFSSEGFDHILDYGRSIEEIFIDIAIFLLPTLKLWLLLSTRHPHTLNMPSWVPDWSQNAPTSIEWFNGFWTTTGSDGDTDSDSNSHAETGFDFDHTSAGNSYGSSDIRKDLTVRLDGDNNSETGEDPKRISGCYVGENSRIRESFCDDASCHESHKILCIQGTQYSSITSLSSTFDFKNIKDQCWRTIDCMEKLCRTSENAEANQANKLLHDSLLSPQICAAIQKLGDFGLQTLLGRNHYQNPDKNDEFIANVQESLQICQIFLDDTDNLGIAPESSQIGDSVCFFKDAVSGRACLLRKRIGGDWILVSGDCFILDIESINDLDVDDEEMEEFAIW